MKKKFKTIIIILILFLFVLMPITTSAKEPTDKFLSKIEIQDDGDVLVKELIKMNGDYNGMTRDIYFRNPNNLEATETIEDIYGNNTLYDGSSISDVRVGSIKENSELSFDDFNKNINYFDEVPVANNGESSKYTYNTSNLGVNLKLYNPSSLKEIFYIEYKVTDVVVVHNDIAEFAFNVLGDGYKENIGEFKVKVILPSTDKDYKVWLHGPLNGNIERTNNRETLGTFDFLGAYNPVSVRLIFDKTLVPKATKYSGLVAKDAIIKYQNKLSDEANKEREAIKRANMILIIISSIWGLVTIILVGIIYSKEKKMKKTEFNMQYFREIPGTYGPYVLEYLLDKNVTEKSLSAIILDLIDKKVLKVEIIDKKGKDDYKLVLQEYDEASLTEPESIAIKLLINEIGNSKEVVLSTIKKHCSDITNANRFMELYNDFISTSKSLGKNEQFFAKSPKLVVSTVLFSLLGIILVFYSISFDLIILTIIIIGLIIFSIIFIATRRFYTKKGALDYAKWMAHKRFLEDFSRFDEKELPEVILWDKYLVYAVILGCADKLSKEMKIKMASFNDTDTSYIGYDPFLHHYIITNNIYHSINSGVHTAVASSRASIAASQAANSGGSGGSIGGGGTFGGGGGGGRF